MRCYVKRSGLCKHCGYLHGLLRDSNKFVMRFGRSLVCLRQFIIKIAYTALEILARCNHSFANTLAVSEAIVFLAVVWPTSVKGLLGLVKLIFVISDHHSIRHRRGQVFEPVWHAHRSTGLGQSRQTTTIKTAMASSLNLKRCVHVFVYCLNNTSCSISLVFQHGRTQFTI